MVAIHVDKVPQSAYSSEVEVTFVVERWVVAQF